jgi:hypothetical protein
MFYVLYNIYFARHNCSDMPARLKQGRTVMRGGSKADVSTRLGPEGLVLRRCFFSARFEQQRETAAMSLAHLESIKLCFSNKSEVLCFIPVDFERFP